MWPKLWPTTWLSMCSIWFQDLNVKPSLFEINKHYQNETHYDLLPSNGVSTVAPAILAAAAVIIIQYLFSSHQAYHLPSAEAICGKTKEFVVFLVPVAAQVATNLGEIAGLKDTAGNPTMGS